MEPRLTIVGGGPAPEEIAAVVTVLTARLASAGQARAGEAMRNGWSSRSRMMRSPLSRGPGGWRASALPR
jgi:Acyl-CoA carboxylase epsilon subunit